MLLGLPDLAGNWWAMLAVLRAKFKERHHLLGISTFADLIEVVMLRLHKTKVVSSALVLVLKVGKNMKKLRTRKCVKSC